MILLDRELETTTGAVLTDGPPLRDLIDYERREVLMRAAIDSIGAERLTRGTNASGSEQVRGYLPSGMKVSPADAAKICFRTAGKLIDIGV